VKKNLRKKDKGKILAVLIAVMLIVSCMPAGIAFAAAPVINVTLTPDSNTVGNAQTVSVAVYASNVSSPASVTASLVDSAKNNVSSVPLSSGSTGAETISGTVYGVATLSLVLPDTLTAGDYFVKVNVASVTDAVYSPYTINAINSGGGGGSSTVVNTPAVQTEAATTITATSAVLNGDITSNNGYAVTDYGFLWGTSSSSLANKLDVGTDNHSGAFTDTLSSLTTGTTYYFEAYATDSYGTADGAVMSFTAGVTTPTTPAAPTTPVFSDVSASYWGYSAISSLASKGIIAGYPDGTFKPDASITRAEFATMLVKALALNTSGTTGTFTDVTTGAWYYGTVNAAASAGIVSGMGDNLFAPNALVTREQMAVMVAKALGNKAPTTDGTELNAFSDKSAVSSWAVSGMDEAVKAGIVSGMTADTLAPMANATRAQAAEMIYKMLAV
jgi:hypothetical protein